MHAKLMRRHLILAGTAVFLVCCAGIAPAQPYPNRPIRIIDAYPAGGAADFLARTVAPKLSANLGQSVVVENRPGAGGNLGADVAAKSPADGYTLFMGLTSALAPSVTLYPKLPYDMVKDFAPVSRVGTGVYAFVCHPSLPVKSVKELIALARARPGQLNYGSSGNGSGPHLAGELFKNKTGVKLVHVPYKGGPPSVTAVISGETELGFMSVASALSQIKAGRMRALGVTSPQRIAALPDVPTVAEAGVPGYEVVPTFGIYTPTATPKEIVALLNAELRKIVALPDVRERFATQGIVASGSTPAELAKVLAAEIELWAKVIKDANIRVD